MVAVLSQNEIFFSFNSWVVGMFVLFLQLTKMGRKARKAELCSEISDQGSSPNLGDVQEVSPTFPSTQNLQRNEELAAGKAAWRSINNLCHFIPLVGAVQEVLTWGKFLSWRGFSSGASGVWRRDEQEGSTRALQRNLSGEKLESSESFVGKERKNSMEKGRENSSEKEKTAVKKRGNSISEVPVGSVGCEYLGFSA